MPFIFRRVFAASTTAVAFALCLGAALPAHATAVVDAANTRRKVNGTEAAPL